MSNDSNDEDKDVMKRITNSQNNNDQNKEQEDHPLVFFKNYMPERENIKEKGRLSKAQTVLFSIGSSVYEPYKDDLSDDTFDNIVEFLNGLERRQISVDGKSREEFKDMFSSMFSSLHMQDERDGNSGGFVEKFIKSEKGDK